VSTEDGADPIAPLQGDLEDAQSRVSGKTLMLLAAENVVEAS